ncbi:helix-turn-helix domain-containing protein [Agrobacterium sp. B1(2019)]|uniref:helix-turn-helix domain-containing protein n=1 Tax=Agrobacterium sp. B1(2019) TaxID=2607032 RepID=UPI0011EFA9A5|nr:helix-turn-helix domain-containing protein [Agrobacterium sp. B1(2019)]TZG31254.1 helix-turn-helix domain-containing protein [Agrobacterium sp. B1(2019)]
MIRFAGRTTLCDKSSKQLPFLANLAFFTISSSAEVDDNVKDVLTTAKAAELLGVSTRTAQLWVESGQLPSWKTPGGHRRIPRQAVLDLIENPIREEPIVRAHAIIFAGEGRADQWRQAGLPALGLLVDVSEDMETIRAWLATIPPMLVIVESADQEDRKKLLSSLEKDARFGKTTIVNSAPRNAAEPVKLGANSVRTKMQSDVRANAAAIVEFLLENASGTTQPTAFRTPWNEDARLRAVTGSALVGSEPELGFDRLVRLAAHATNAPIAMFTLITEAEQWFKSRLGFDGVSTPRDWAFCNETLIANEFTILEDLSKRENLVDNPTLSEPYGFRFYAGAPVRDPLGFILGSICVIDVVPRTLSDPEREAMTTIADAASNMIRTRVLEHELQDLQGNV